MGQEWSSEPANLLSAELIQTVREVLDHGMICGLRAFYCGGGGPEACAFSDFEAYLSYVEGCRPGDWLTLWSVPALDAQGRLLLRKRETPVSLEELQRITQWLRGAPGREFLATGKSDSRAAPETSWGDDDSLDELRELAERCARTGELAVLPLTELAGTGEWIPKFHVVDAKRPNERGEVPLGGPY